MFFEAYFGLEGEDGEQRVCCPFPHPSADGSTHEDHNPSMYINLNKRVYCCKTCGEQGSETNLIAKLFGTTTVKAQKFLTEMRKNYRYETVKEEFDKHVYTPEAQEYALTLGMDLDVLRDMLVMIDRVNNHWELSFPVFYKGYLIDIRKYRQGMTPKVLSLPGAPSGLLIPYDAVMADERSIILCAGEKDMAVARSNGFNACTLTGGEASSPLAPAWFTGKRVAICYDNDHTGRMGAARVAHSIAKYAKEVRIVTAFHKDFPEVDSKEDLTDWFMKYEGTSQKLLEYIKQSPKYEYTDEELESEIPTVKLKDACTPKYQDCVCKSDVQVLTMSDLVYEAPTQVRLRKSKNSKEAGALQPGETVIWEALDTPAYLLTTVGQGEAAIERAAKKATRLSSDKSVYMDLILQRKDMYICTIADINVGYDEMTEVTAYCLGCRPVQGRKYTMTYHRLTDPEHGCVAFLVTEIELASDSINSFRINDRVKANLEWARHCEGTIADKVDRRANAVRGLLGYEANLTLIKAIDLCFNSVKAFKFGSAEHIRGYTDVLVIGESRIGKSDTAKKLRDAYDAGTFTSLAGSAATIPGIIGGSVKDALGRQSTKAGVIPRNNEGLIIFEELAKAPEEVIKSLTDVRSSGLARITRVSGSIEMPASLRMLTLSNPRPTQGGESRPVEAYSSGLEIIKDLIGTAEDIARYDYVYIQGDDHTESDPLYDAPEPFAVEVLQDCLNWTWSRSEENIKWMPGVEKYLNEQAKALNAKYPMHIKLFGTECWKKLCRLTIACACYVVSTDESYEDVLISKEHVDWAVNFLEGLYNNNTFKLNAVVAESRKNTEVVAEHTADLQTLYVKYAEPFDYLYKTSKVDKGSFKDLADMDNQTFSGLMRKLIARNFVSVDRTYIYSTVKFKSTYELIDRNHTEVPSV